jgi:hypothetical protein
VVSRTLPRGVGGWEVGSDTRLVVTAG